MFGINTFEQVNDIVKGHYNEITNKENALYEKRIKICRQCPLFTDSFGGICDSKKCYNTEKKESVEFPGKNTICGCGCRLQAKTRLAKAKCVLNKW